MITFGGEPLLIPDEDGELQEWVDRFRPLDNLLLSPISTVSGRAREQGHWPHAVGLPRPNWQQLPPRWKLNSLWWPTGASRFAVGLFLVDAAGAQRIANAIGSNGSAILAMHDGVRSFSTTMWALPARPISNSLAEKPLMLLPLVDRRYWWQWAQLGQMFVGPLTTWENIRTAMTSALGVSVSQDDPEDAYLAPDWSEFDRWHENAAVVMDAYAATVGQRFVAKFDGSFALRKFDQDETVVEQNIQAVSLVAGGEIVTTTGAAPGNVAVVFQKRQGGIVHQNGVCEIKIKSAEDYGFNANAPGTATIHTTFQANFSTRGGEADNDTAMDDLANQIAEDFYGWKKKQYSVTLPGLGSNWTPAGYDDYLWIQFGTPHDGQSGEPRLCHTIIESLPLNFCVEENLTQEAGGESPRTFRPCPVHRAELTSDWEEGQSGRPYFATAKLLYESSGGYPPQGFFTKDEFEVKIFDTMGLRGSLKSEDKVWVAALPADSEMFELVSGAKATSDKKKFRLTSNITNGVATGVLIEFQGGAYVDGIAVNIIDWWKFTAPNSRGMWTGEIHEEGWCVDRGSIGSGGRPDYEIVWMEQDARFIEFTATQDMGATLSNRLELCTVTEAYGQGLDPGLSDVYDDSQRYPDVIAGAKGTAIRDEYDDPNDPIFPTYRIVDCQRIAIFAEATLASDLNEDDNLADVTSPSWNVIEDGMFVSDPGIANVNIANGRRQRGFAGDSILCYRSGNEKLFGKWVFGILRVDRNDRSYVGRTVNAIAKGAAGNVTRLHAGTLVATGQVDNVKNLWADVGDDKLVKYADVDGVKVMDAAECPMTP